MRPTVTGAGGAGASYHERVRALEGIVRQRCPRCRTGPIFRKPVWRGWLAMNERCPVCGLKLNREQGYFLGAMYLSFFLSIIPALFLVFLFWRVVGLGYETSLLTAAIAYLPLVPSAVRLSRVLWIYIDQASDPE